MRLHMACGGMLVWHARLRGLPGVDRVTLQATNRLGAQRIEFFNDDWAVRSPEPSPEDGAEAGLGSPPGCSPTQPYEGHDEEESRGKAGVVPGLPRPPTSPAPDTLPRRSPFKRGGLSTRTLERTTGGPAVTLATLAACLMPTPEASTRPDGAPGKADGSACEEPAPAMAQALG
eukprot:11410596-Alexandrium_andersonii.AAC.1